MPRLSVLLPVKNAQTTIDLAVRSTLRALPRDAELVIWDDGSDDGTDARLSRWKERDRRIQVVRSGHSVGGGSALRELFEQTDSEYIARMDADDVCLPGRFKHQLRELRTLDISFSPAVAFSTQPMGARPSAPIGIRPEEAPLSLVVGNKFIHPGMSARREAIASIGGYAPVRRAQDYELWMRAASRGLRIGESRLPRLGYRISPTQITQSDGYRVTIAGDPTLRRAYGDLLSFLNFTTSSGDFARELLMEQVEAQADAHRPAFRRLLSRLSSAPGSFVFSNPADASP